MGSLNNSQNFVVPQGGGGGGMRRAGGVMGLITMLLGRKQAREDAIFRANLSVDEYGRKKTIDTAAHQDKTDISSKAKMEEVSHKTATETAGKIYAQREGLKTSRRHIKAVNKITLGGNDKDPNDPTGKKKIFNPEIAEINEKGGVKMQKTGQKRGRNRTEVANTTDANPNPSGGGGGNS